MSGGAHAGGRWFTAAEELACHFDTAAEPCNIHLETAAGGRLDEAALRSAAAAALTASARTASRRAPRGPLSRGYRWQRAGRLDADPVSAAAYADAAQLARLRERFLAAAPPVDLAPPVRLLLASGPGGDHVILNAHHAVMDGMSCLELMRDLARRYRAAAGLAPARPAAADSIPPPTGRAAAAGPPGTGRAGLRPARPARIAAERGGGTGCGIHLELLPAVPAVRPLAGGARPTLNETLAAALILAVGQWNSAHGRPVRPVAVTIPVNTRRPGTPFTAGNQSRLTTVRVPPLPPGAAAGPLLREVAAQARAARGAAGRPQIGWASRALAGRWCPAGARRRAVRLVLATAAPLLADTVMLSNLGNVPDPPDFGVPGAVTMAFSVPAQMPRGLSVGVITAGGRLQLGVRYNRALLDGPAAARFTALLLDALAGCALAPRPALPAPH